MVATQKYQVITRVDIERLLANQQIQVSSILSAENIHKLRLQNISYIVTGSVDGMDDNYLVTIKIFDVSTVRSAYSADAFMGSRTAGLYNGVAAIERVLKKGAEEMTRLEKRGGGISSI